MKDGPHKHVVVLLQGCLVGLGEGNVEFLRLVVEVPAQGKTRELEASFQCKWWGGRGRRLRGRFAGVGSVVGYRDTISSWIQGYDQ